MEHAKKNTNGFISLGAILFLLLAVSTIGWLTTHKFPKLTGPIDIIKPSQEGSGNMLPIPPSDQANNPPSAQNKNDGASISITGEIGCLPKTGGGQQTAECAIGLKTEGDKYYALKNLFEHDPEYKYSKNGTKVKITGTWKEEKASGPGGATYDTLGSITMATIQDISENGSAGKEIAMHEEERVGPLLVDKIYSDHISGLNYIDYPVARSDGFPITLKIGESASNGCNITLTLTRIDGKTAYFTEAANYNRVCPI